VRRTTKLVLKALAVVGLLLVAVLLERQLHLSAILEPSRIEAQLHAAGPLGPALFIFVMGAAVVSPVPTFPLDILAGRVFGAVLGTLYAVTGATLGAMVSFLLARWLGRDLIARFLKGHINFCQQCSDKLLIKVVFFARLIPAVSFDMVSYGSGLTRMSWTKFAVATFVGMLPLTWVLVSVGPMLSLSRTVVWIGGSVVVALFFLLPRWIEKYDLFGMSRFFEHPSDLIES
jgi:uncharacterized membrane protein YdjX (TVP38/TMEM64 family)